MTPQTIASRVDLTCTFLDVIGYGRMPGESPVHRETLCRLTPHARTMLVAWLWPSDTFDSKFDLDAAARRPQSPWELRRKVAPNFRRLLATAVKAARRPYPEVAAHVGWRAALSDRDLARLLNGEDGFAVETILDLCDALQLDVRDQWVVVDSSRLDRRISASLTALDIVSRLRALPAERVESFSRRVPSDVGRGGGEDEVIGPYLAPPVGSRYRPLFEYLATLTEQDPVLDLDGIDSILRSRGGGLPPSAFADRSWWAGSGEKPAGRPQISAWWAAGYRVKGLSADHKSGRYSKVRLASLPGRESWLQDESRVERGAFRLPQPDYVTRTSHSADLVPEYLEPSDLARPEPSTQASSTADKPAASLQGGPSVVAALQSGLRRLGEADRSGVAEIVGPGVRENEISNLLTRARRQGVLVNHGTRARPRWVGTGSKGDLMLQIGAVLEFDIPEVGRGDTIRSDFFRFVADRLGLTVPDGMTRAGLVRMIIESSGIDWSPTFVSVGSTVTLDGLRAVREAVRLRTGR